MTLSDYKNPWEGMDNEEVANNIRELLGTACSSIQELKWWIYCGLGNNLQEYFSNEQLDQLDDIYCLLEDLESHANSKLGKAWSMDQLKRDRKQNESIIR